MKLTIKSAAIAVACISSFGTSKEVPAAESAVVGKFRPTAQDKIVPADAKVELLWNEGDFTEGPVAAPDGAILFSDIGDRIMRFDPRTRATSVFRAPSGKSNGLALDSQGRLVACEGAAPGGNRRISITDRQGHVSTLAERWQGKRFNSPNDLAIDRGGRVYFTDPRYVGDEPREIEFEAVFLITPNGEVRLATRDVQKPNGIAISPDAKLVYLADTNSDPQGNHQLVAFQMQTDGTLADKHVLFDFGPNGRGIDGMKLDRQGNIYAAAGSGPEAGIYVFSPTGVPLALITLPGDPSNCAFGIGPEAQTLYITGEGPLQQGSKAKRKYGLYRIALAVKGHHLFPPDEK